MNGRVEPNPIMPVGNGSRSQEPNEPNRALGRTEQLKERAQSIANERIEVIAQRIDSVGSAFRRTGENLRSEDQADLSKYAELIGDRVSNAARYLREHDPAELTHEVESFARRQPAIFLGGAFAIGLLAARFLKSSAERRQAAVEVEPEIGTDFSGGYGGGGYPS